MPINDNNLFFACSLIERIGRMTKQKRGDVVRLLGASTIGRIYENADILHCEPIEKTADIYIQMLHIEEGQFDNVARCVYEAPDDWTIGEVYARLIEDLRQASIVQGILDVYGSWIDDSISNYNSDFYYQPRDYIYACYKANAVL